MTARTTVTRTKARAHGGRPPLGDEARQRILDATAAVFLERGFASASTRDIAERAHTSKQTLYRLFPTKADLFVGVIGGYTNSLFDRHVEFVESDRAPRETLNEMGRMMLGLFADPTFLSLYRILVAEAHRFPDLAQRLWDDCMERGYALLGDYLRSHHLGGPSYRKAARKFIFFVLGDFVVNSMLNPDTTLSPRVLRTRVSDAVDDFLGLYAPARHKRQR